MYFICLHYHKIIANVVRDGIKLLISKNTCNIDKNKFLLRYICFPGKKF